MRSTRRRDDEDTPLGRQMQPSTYSKHGGRISLRCGGAAVRWYGGAARWCGGTAVRRGGAAGEDGDVEDDNDDDDNDDEGDDDDDDGETIAIMPVHNRYCQGGHAERVPAGRPGPVRQSPRGGEATCATPRKGTPSACLRGAAELRCGGAAALRCGGAVVRPPSRQVRRGSKPGTPTGLLLPSPARAGAGKPQKWAHCEARAGDPPRFAALGAAGTGGLNRHSQACAARAGVGETSAPRLLSEPWTRAFSTVQYLKVARIGAGRACSALTGPAPVPRHGRTHHCAPGTRRA